MIQLRRGTGSAEHVPRIAVPRPCGHLPAGSQVRHEGLRELRPAGRLRGPLPLRRTHPPAAGPPSPYHWLTTGPLPSSPSPAPSAAGGGGLRTPRCLGRLLAEAPGLRRPQRVQRRPLRRRCCLAGQPRAGGPEGGGLHCALVYSFMRIHCARVRWNAAAHLSHCPPRNGGPANRLPGAQWLRV